MAEKTQEKNRKRKYYEMDKSRQSPFQNPQNSREPTGVVSKAPRGINASEFAESRALEIHNMMQALSSASKQSNKRVFQSLPRHMRRRAASHNSKRMPVRLRDAYNREALKSQEKQKEPSKQKKSRRHRRKPSNLLAEYTRRQRKHAWLETHIWHAKRFKMVEKWGYKIPLHPNDKSIRASYRALANACLLQDISYYQCTEVLGKQEMLVAAMKHLTSSEIGPTISGKEYLSGQYEGHVVLYQYDQYPHNAIGPVMFLWQEKQVNNTSTNQMVKLWVWSHPVCSEEVTKAIVHACSLEGPTEYVDSKPWLSVETGEDAKNMTPVIKSSENESEITVTLLHEQLVRLRLTGPKSHALLVATLELCDWSTKGDSNGSQWWQEYSKNEGMNKMLVEQNTFWDQLKGVSTSRMLKAGSVLALIVKDPRLGLPVRKSSIDIAAEHVYKDLSSEESSLTSLSGASAISPLWDKEVRLNVKQNKIKEKDLNNLRSKQAVPGSKLDLGDHASRIPIFVIQQPGNYQTSTINFGCGYDVIIPAGWSMAFWIAFVYRGARVGGARELATCSREQGVPHFPCDFPDTQSGREYNEEQRRIGEEKYKGYPPAKRPNYVKFAIDSPFAPDWITFVDYWSVQIERLQDEMRKMVGSERSGNTEGIVATSDEERIQCLEKKSIEFGDCLENNEVRCSDNSKEISYDTKSLSEEVVCSSVKSEMKEPTNESDKTDNQTSNLQFTIIRTLSTRKQLQDIIFSLTQTKKNRSQKNKLSDKEILAFLTKTMTFYRRSLVCINLRPLMKGCPHDNAVIYLPTLQDLKKLQKEKSYGGPTEPVHKCNNSTSMIGQSSRNAIGSVTSGQYSFVRGQGVAIGFCSLPGFCELILRTLQEKCNPVVLVRNTSTFQYRFASVIIV